MAAAPEDNTLTGNEEIKKVLELLEEHVNIYNLTEFKDEVALCEFPTTEEQSLCVTHVKKHLSQHVEMYSIHQTAVDLYKLTAWMGMFFYHEITKREGVFPLFVVTATLNYLLELDHRCLPDRMLRKIAHMATHDKTNKDEWAIGHNGLYITFRACYELQVVSPPNP